MTTFEDQYSVQHWNKEGGRRGCLAFVEEYIP
jgi:hypothetical protein